MLLIEKVNGLVCVVKWQAKLLAPLLLGLGLDEFSMSATSILAQRKRIRELSYEESKKVAEKATTELSTMEEVVELVKSETGIEG